MDLFTVALFPFSDFRRLFHKNHLDPVVAVANDRAPLHRAQRTLDDTNLQQQFITMVVKKYLCAAPRPESWEEKAEGNTSSASSVSSTGAVSESKRSLALKKIADSHTNSTESLVIRGRRNRKQPTLYQPQMCADSRWKSDENHLGTGSSDSNDSDSSDSETDNSKEESKELSKGTHRNPRRPNKQKRTRGRPAKLKVENESTPTLSSPRKRSRTPKAAAMSGEKTPRKRGRPSKSTKNTPTTTPSSSRKRGRPPKTATTPTSPSKTSPSPTPRKRGRPPKASPDSSTNPNKTDSAVKRKVSKPATPSSTMSNKSSNAKVEIPVKTPEPVKVSRVSGRTVKRASFHDEVDEGEQHLRSSKSPQSGDTQSTNQTLKSAVVKSQETQLHRRNSKTPEKSEPTRKKQKLEEKAATQTKDTPSEIKLSKAQSKKNTIAKDKDDEIADPPPIAPVRMKPVLEPPAAPLAPVRMKPVLQPPAPVTIPPVSVSETENLPKETEPNTEKAEKPAVDTKVNIEEKKETTVVQVTGDPVIVKPEVSKKVEPLPPTSISPKENKPGATIAIKAVTPNPSTQRASPTLVPGVSSTGIIPASSIASTFNRTPLLDPVALDAAVRALPEPKEKKGEKTGVTKTPRRKPGARECMQISRRFGASIIPEKYMTTLLDYCHRGKVEHLIKMRERLDCHSRFLEYQLAGLEARVKEVGESKIVVPPMPLHKRDSSSRHRGAAGRVSPTPHVVNKKSASIGVASTNKAVVKPIVDSQTPGGSLTKTNVGNAAKKIQPAKSTEAPKRTNPPPVPAAPKPMVTQPLALASKTKTN